MTKKYDHGMRLLDNVDKLLVDDFISAFDRSDKELVKKVIVRLMQNHAWDNNEAITYARAFISAVTLSLNAQGIEELY